MKGRGRKEGENGGWRPRKGKGVEQVKENVQCQGERERENERERQRERETETEGEKDRILEREQPR